MPNRATRRSRLAALAAQQGGVTRTDVTYGAQKCGWCREPMKTLFAIASEKGALPTNPNSVVVCHHCTGLNWTDERGALVKMDDEFRSRVDPEDLADLDLAAEHMRKLKRARGERAIDPRKPFTESR